MIRVALHDSICLEDGDVLAAIESIADASDCGLAVVTQFGNAIDLMDCLVAKDGQIIDLLILPSGLPGLTSAHAITEARESVPMLRVVMVADSAKYASRASAVGVDGYLMKPLTLSGFETVVGTQMKAVANLHANSFVVNSRGGASRIRYSDVLYCETSGHDQIIHLVDSSVVSLRASSQALYETLSQDTRFFKAGSSNILNLDKIVELRNSGGYVDLVDGSQLSVPVRLRKSLEATLLA